MRNPTAVILCLMTASATAADKFKSLPAIKAEREYKAAIAKAKKEYLKKLDAALKLAGGKGDVAEVKRIAREKELLVEPPSAGLKWVVLFRHDDPSQWGKESHDGEKRTILPSTAPKHIKWLRLRRMDTGDYVIIPMKHDWLSKAVEVGRGIIWDGTAQRRFAAGLNSWKLGIARKQWRGSYGGSVPVFVHTGRASRQAIEGYGGWGFGPGNAYRTSTHYAWANKSIGKAVFEISVKAGRLTLAEATKVLK